MPLEIIRNDIVNMRTDVIVNATDCFLSGSGGVDRRIHLSAGKELDAECSSIGGCQTGKAVITSGCRLPCKYIIHTVGPVWKGGSSGEIKDLESCYLSALSLALRYNCKTAAFPIISAGSFGFPKELALKTAVGAIGRFLNEYDMTVYLVVFDKTVFNIGERLYSDIAEYIDDRYAELYGSAGCLTEPEMCVRETVSMPLCAPEYKDGAQDDVKLEIRRRIDGIDESFSQMLLRKIDEKGMKDSECYKRANIDRKLFSKIRSDANYRPSKPTAAAFAVALELTLPETQELMRKAGFALSHSSKFDIIVEYFISRGVYDIFEINEALFAFDQSILGGRA